MKMEYCCDQMRSAIDEERIDIDYSTKTADMDGWEIYFCPFCGERIECEVTVKNKKVKQ